MQGLYRRVIVALDELSGRSRLDDALKCKVDCGTPQIVLKVREVGGYVNVVEDCNFEHFHIVEITHGEKFVSIIHC